jgi:hypothetical protein
MAYRVGYSNDERGIDGSRMADFDYGLLNGFGRRHSFDVSEAYQQGRPWIYADYWLRLNPSLPGIGAAGEQGYGGERGYKRAR